MFVPIAITTTGGRRWSRRRWRSTFNALRMNRPSRAWTSNTLRATSCAAPRSTLSPIAIGGGSKRCAWRGGCRWMPMQQALAAPGASARTDKRARPRCRISRRRYRRENEGSVPSVSRSCHVVDDQAVDAGVEEDGALLGQRAPDRDLETGVVGDRDRLGDRALALARGVLAQAEGLDVR